MNQYLTVEEIQRPVKVGSIVIDLDRLPSWKDILVQLPVGTGIKGGVARKVLKVLCGLKWEHPDFRDEMTDDNDLDIVIAVNRVTPELRLHLRKEFEGRSLGDLTLEAEDIEVTDNMKWYFLTRDITMNECLLFKVSQLKFRLYYSEQAVEDTPQGIIRPSTHCLHNGYSQVWFLWRGEPVVGDHNLARAIVRMVKGHGRVYGIDAHTFQCYRKKGMPDIALWRILRPFHTDKEKYLEAVMHLEELRLIPRLKTDVQRLELWGQVFSAINTGLARRGKLLNPVSPDAKAVEDWIAYKEEMFRRWQIRRKIRQALGRRVTPDFRAEVRLPKGLESFPSFYVL